MPYLLIQNFAWDNLWDEGGGACECSSLLSELSEVLAASVVDVPVSPSVFPLTLFWLPSFLSSIEAKRLSVLANPLLAARCSGGCLNLGVVKGDEEGCCCCWTSSICWSIGTATKGICEGVVEAVIFWVTFPARKRPLSFRVCKVGDKSCCFCASSVAVFDDFESSGSRLLASLFNSRRASNEGEAGGFAAYTLVVVVVVGKRAVDVCATWEVNN